MVVGDPTHGQSLESMRLRTRGEVVAAQMEIPDMRHGGGIAGINEGMLHLLGQLLAPCPGEDEDNGWQIALLMEVTETEIQVVLKRLGSHLAANRPLVSARLRRLHLILELVMGEKHGIPLGQPGSVGRLLKLLLAVINHLWHILGIQNTMLQRHGTPESADEPHTHLLRLPEPLGKPVRGRERG